MWKDNQNNSSVRAAIRQFGMGRSALSLSHAWLTPSSPHPAALGPGPPTQGLPAPSSKNLYKGPPGRGNLDGTELKKKIMPLLTTSKRLYQT